MRIRTGGHLTGPRVGHESGPMVTARDVASHIESLAPLTTAIPGDQNGFLFGQSDEQLSGVVVCWSPTVAVLEEVAARRANMVVSHEALFFDSSRGDAETGSSEWIAESSGWCKMANLKRLEVLLANGICVYRAHSNWDVTPEVGIVASMAGLLGLRELVARGRMIWTFRVKPTTVGSLAGRVKTLLDLPAVRVVGDVDRRVSRVAIAPGGLGQLFNSPEEAHNLGAEVAIFGEMVDYTIRHAVELGLAAIETSHVASENPGMKAMAHQLQAWFPSLPVHFLDSGMVWRVL